MDVENGRHRLGKMNIICDKCLALKWKGETKGLCCLDGKIQLAPLQPPPDSIFKLLTKVDPDTKQPYINKIRAYNQILAFTSIETKLDTNLANAEKGVYTYKIHGQHYHQHGSFNPNSIEGEEPEPNFAQIYYYDGMEFDKQLERRHQIMKESLSKDMLRELQWDLFFKNPFVQTFISAKDREAEDKHEILNIVIYNTHGKDMRNYNMPTCSEVAILYGFESKPTKRDIIIKRNDNSFVRISEMHGAFDPLQYPLLFPYGEYGWHKNILRANVVSKKNKKGKQKETEAEEIVEETIEEVAEIEEATETAAVVEEGQVFNIDDHAVELYTIQQLYVYHQESLNQSDLTEQQINFHTEKLKFLQQNVVIQQKIISEDVENVEMETEETEETEEEPQTTMPIETRFLFKRQASQMSQASQTGLTHTMEDVDIKSSQTMSISDPGEIGETGETTEIAETGESSKAVKKIKTTIITATEEPEEAYKISETYIDSENEKDWDEYEDNFDTSDISQSQVKKVDKKGKGKEVETDIGISEDISKEIVESEEEIPLPTYSEKELEIGFDEQFNYDHNGNYSDYSDNDDNDSENTGDNDGDDAGDNTGEDSERPSKIQQKKQKGPRKTVSIREFAAYRFMYRDSNRKKSTLHLAGRLFQQYIVDQYVKWETNNLIWQYNNQPKLRTETYQGLSDMISNNDANANQVGKQIILASSFTGSTRYFQQLYQDAMSIVREFGKPDLFITVTCNPKWPEITQELLYNQKAPDRPDLVARVFKLKLEAITHDLYVRGVLGEVVAYVQVIEFQKRGLPHAHILIMLASEDKPQTPEDFDNIVSAEIPDKDTQPKLFRTVTRNMIHGPCGDENPKSPCMVDGKCSKHFPRDFVATTTTNKNGYPLYKRREDGTVIQKKGVSIDIDNRWVVPYNPYLSKKYNCHINVEICSSIKSVKYLYKYIYKGEDRVLISLVNPKNEIEKFVNARYVSASEGIWRLFNFGLQKRSHTVERLPVHLDGEQNIYFRKDQDIPSMLEKGQHTKLTRYFELCKDNSEDPFFQKLKYIDVPKYFIWKENNWVKRKRGGAKVISRMHFVNPKNEERFYLRAILNRAEGRTGFDNTMTINATKYNSYKEAAAQLGLVNDDGECDACLTEAITYKMPYQLRQLFASIIVYCQPANLKDLWNKYVDSLIEDYINKKMSRELAIQKTLVFIKNYLIQNGLDLSDYPELPPLNFEEGQEHTLISDEQNYNQDDINETLNNLDNLNIDQKAIFKTIIKAINGEIEQKLFFVDGPGGTGKTYLYNMILAHVRSSSESGLNGIAIAVASSGIAALLMNGGRTAHSRFKIPLKLTKNTTLNIKKQSELADLIRKAKVILWDEAPMMNKFAFEAVDKSFQDLMNNTNLFGGKIIVLGGDFRQILPVVVRGNQAKIVSHTS